MCMYDLCCLVPGAAVLNVAIDKHRTAELT